MLNCKSKQIFQNRIIKLIIHYKIGWSFGFWSQTRSFMWNFNVLSMFLDCFYENQKMNSLQQNKKNPPRVHWSRIRPRSTQHRKKIPINRNPAVYFVSNLCLSFSSSLFLQFPAFLISCWSQNIRSNRHNSCSFFFLLFYLLISNRIDEQNHQVAIYERPFLCAPNLIDTNWKIVDLWMNHERP